jgi:rhodanese-related sulfurtransferase
MMHKFLALLLTITIGVLGCAQKNTVVNADAFEKGIKDKTAQILDVSTMDEYNNGHIKNALQANWLDTAQFNYRIAHIDKQKPVYIYCQAGSRSSKANAHLQQLGFKKIIELQGGMIAWKQAQKNVEGTSNETQLTMQDYQKLIADTSKIYLVDFGADWCAPCVQQKPILESLQKQYDKKFTLITIDAGVHINLKTEMQVALLPTLFVYKHGKQTMRFEGLTPKEMLEKELFKP